ncbi:MAG TPA: hypothetical protein VLV29_01720 [Steroidobacteraceae bacterium]|nr:hypothetical protein [Steroidobacteraceae bacterium]
MEESFLQLWDELDDVLCACRHLATCAAAETLATAAPFIAALLGGAATVLIAHHRMGLLPL